MTHVTHRSLLLLMVHHTIRRRLPQSLRTLQVRHLRRLASQALPRIKLQVQLQHHREIIIPSLVVVWRHHRPPTVPVFPSLAHPLTCIIRRRLLTIMHTE